MGFCGVVLLIALKNKKLLNSFWCLINMVVQLNMTGSKNLAWRLKKELGLEASTTHGLRYSAASELAEAWVY